MRIVFVISSMDSGGAERVASILTDHWVNMGHKVHLVTYSKEKSFYKINKKISLAQLDLLKESGNILSSLKNNIVRIIALRKYFISVKPDIIISFMTTTNMRTIISSRMLKIPTIVSERTIKRPPGMKKTKDIFRDCLYRFCDAVIVQTNIDKASYKYSENIHVIPNPILSIKKTGASYLKKEKIILGVGRLNMYKGFHLLIDAFSLLKERNGYKLVIIGDGQERENLLKQVKKYKLQKLVQILHRKKNVFEYFRKSDIFVLPSFYEGYPNVLMEAMYFGCACISFDCEHGPSEIITHGKNGLLVEKNNVQELSRRLQYLITSSQIKKTLQKNALEIIEKNNIQKIMSMWDNLIRHVVSK